MKSGKGCGRPEPGEEKDYPPPRARTGAAEGREVDELLCVLLRGEAAAWPRRGQDSFAAAFLARSAYHGVQALLSARWKQGGRPLSWGWPKGVLDACANRAFAQAMWELRHRWLLGRVLARLSEIGVSPILFKGTALAYDLYPAPFLRERGDTDLLVLPRERDPVIRALEALGLTRVPNVSGEWISYEAGFGWIDPVSRQMHLLDLHWKVNNSELLSQLLSQLLSYEELRAQIQPLPALCAEAVALKPVYALLLACIHRGVHKQQPFYVDGVAHYGGDRLIWLYDIHLLLGRLSPTQHREFVELAERKGLRATCREGVKRALSLLPTAVPEESYRLLDRPGSPGPADRYLDASSSWQFRANFRAIPGLRNKLKFLAELGFPPESYMRWKYAGSGPGWLPWLYLRRARAGIWKSRRARNP